LKILYVYFIVPKKIILIILSFSQSVIIVLTHKTVFLKIIKFEVTFEVDLIASYDFDLLLLWQNIVIVGVSVKIRAIYAVCQLVVEIVALFKMNIWIL